MSPGAGHPVESRKVGAEDAILARLPGDRFHGRVPAHLTPVGDERGRLRVMLLAQACTRCSFGELEAGPTHELHLWLEVGSSPDEDRMEGAELMLPSMRWVALAAATNNPEVEARLRSFGFHPIRLDGVDLHAGGGSVSFSERGRIEWAITGPGRGPARVGVRHAMSMPDDGPEVRGHRVAAVVADTLLGQAGELRVHTSVLAPLLEPGERLPALVHRLPRLQADIVWRTRSRDA